MTDYEKLKVRSFDHWDLYLHDNQCYLGWLCLFSNPRRTIDLFDLEDRPLQELTSVVKLARSALDRLFKPDRINYSCLCNVCPSLHVHIIPRYQTDRSYNGVIFRDANWGKNYAPYNKNFKVSDSLLEALRKEIEGGLE